MADFSCGRGRAFPTGTRRPQVYSQRQSLLVPAQFSCAVSGSVQIYSIQAENIVCDDSALADIKWFTVGFDTFDLKDAKALLAL